MNKEKFIVDKLDELFPNAKCELNYNKDYELLIATVLSSRCTDERVNMVTKELFSKYDIFSLKDAPIEDIEKIIYSVGTHKKKAIFIKNIAKELVDKYNGVVPNNREFLESLSGVGRKTCNVVLSNIYNVPAIAVDTHVKRVSNRLGLVKTDDVKKVESILMQKFPQEKWTKLHHQFIMFGRYICKSQNPICKDCPFKDICCYKKRD